MRRAPDSWLLTILSLAVFLLAGNARAENIAAANPARETPRAETAAMQALDEDEMSGVTGMQGVVLEFKLRNNVNAAFTPIGCTVAVGTPFGTPNPCRMGLEFAARNGVWLMLKEFYGTLHLKDIRMDAGFMPAANTAYYNVARFRDVLGADLIAGANPTNDPAILMTYPDADAQGTYDDMLSFLNIGRAWLEFDCNPAGAGATLCNPATSGYNRDTTLDSALSIRMADSGALNAPAKMRFWGTAYVFGF